MKRILVFVSLILFLGTGFTFAADFDGDGTGDIAVFRDSSGLCVVRGVTRFYFGTVGDLPKANDWEGNGTDRPGIFRGSKGLWILRGLTRVYFGASGDKAKPGDYNGDGTEEIGIFRASSGLWIARGVTRVYFGSPGDRAMAPDAAGGALRRSGLLRTGQTVPYYSGDDANYQTGKPFYYTDHGDGTVTDNVTGLMWPKDGSGLGCWNSQTSSWAEAINYCETLEFAGHLDWRLPNIRELASLINYGTVGPAMDTAVFTNTVWDGYYWTSTPCDNSAYAWSMQFYDGGSYAVHKTVSSIYLRAVRGGQ